MQLQVWQRSIRGLLCAHARSITLEKMSARNVTTHVGGVSI